MLIFSRHGSFTDEIPVSKQYSPRRGGAFHEVSSFFLFFLFQPGNWGGGRGRGLPSMLIVVVCLLLIGSNCILSRLYLCIFFIKLLYFVMGLRYNWLLLIAYIL